MQIVNINNDDSENFNDKEKLNHELSMQLSLQLMHATFNIVINYHEENTVSKVLNFLIKQ